MPHSQMNEKSFVTA